MDCEEEGGGRMGKKSRNSPAVDGRGGFRISVFETWYTPLDGAAQLPSDVL